MERSPRTASLLPNLSTVLFAAGVAFFGWQLAILRGSVQEGRQEVQALRLQLATERGERAELERRSGDLGRRAEELGRALADARESLALTGENVGERLARIEARSAVVEAGFSGLRGEVAAAARRLDEHSAAVAALRRRLDTIAPDDYGALLAPTVKISSKSDVGSGTVLFSRKTGTRFTSFVLTAYHIVEQNYDPKSPIPLEVISFAPDGRQVREERGVVVAANARLDVALVEVTSDRGYDAVAKPIPAGGVDRVRLYSRVSAVGCPLGYAPTPTLGELTSKAKILDGQSYWMINAPTIFGNSGGGIYLTETGEMIGVLSRISAYKNLIDVAVPHMGIITSMGDVHAWLERENFAFLLDPSLSPDEARKARVATRPAEKRPAPELTEALPAAGGLLPDEPAVRRAAADAEERRAAADADAEARRGAEEAAALDGVGGGGPTPKTRKSPD